MPFPNDGSSLRRALARAPNTDNEQTVISASKPAPLPVDDTDLRGRRLGPFELIAPIGVGGMAAVIRATDLTLGRAVALKILPPESARESESVARFEQEARAAAKLDHDNVARAYSCGEDQGLHYIAFEFVEGRTLKAMIDAANGPLAIAAALDLLRQVTAGLAHAAERGVVHRDLKPSNIIVTPDGRAKIVDMGLARSLDNPVDGLTRSGVTLGTFDYISPEQAVEPRLADSRSDIYSLGCTFYHALTGRPPVPEGTAAKKLHHHQQVPPLDPRSLNPLVPDAVAALLGRMMAKDASQRFQTVAELAAALEHLDGASNGPIPAAFLPPTAPPRWGAMAACVAVLGVAVIVGASERLRPVGSTPRLHPPAFAAAQVDPPTRTAPGTASVPVAAQPAQKRQEADSVERLRELLEEPNVHIVLKPDAVYRLESPLKWEGQQLVLESDDPLRPATLRLEGPTDDTDAPASMALLTLLGGQSTLRGLRFETAGGEREPAEACIKAERAERVTVDTCQFPPPERGDAGRAAALLIDEGITATTVRLLQSLLLRGGVGVAVRQRAAVFADGCLFGPHSAAFQFRETARDEVILRLTHCDFLLNGGTVAEADDGAGAAIQAGHCLFSRPAGATGRAHLIREVGSKRGDVKWTGRASAGVPQRNVYHNLSALWSDETNGGNAVAATVDDAKLPRWNFTSGEAVELAASPWQSSRSLELLPTRAHEAFALNTQLPELRLPGDPGIIGPAQNVWGPMYASGLPPLAPVAAPRVKTVDPTQTTSAERGNYRTLAAALAECQPDDTLLLKFNEVVAIEPVRLDRPETRLTLRAFPGYRPVLTLGPTLDAEAALFRLHDGQLAFEGVHFRLKPSRSDFRSQTVVCLTGPGQASFTACTATLEETDEAQLSVVQLPEHDVAMRTVSERKQASVRWAASFARGKGDLIAGRGGRRCDVEIDHALIALDGSLVAMAGSNREVSNAAGCGLKLRRSTVWATDPLLLLRAAREEERHGPGLVPWQVSAQESVLASGAGKPLVRLEGFDSDGAVKQLLTWGESRGNLYANVTGPVLDVQPYGPERMTPAPSYDAGRWLTFTRERDVATPFVRMRFAQATGPVAKALPADFQPVGELAAEAGAIIGELPRTPDEMEP